MSPNWLFLIGLPLVIGGELWGVWRNAHKNGDMDTLSEWEWWLQERKYVGSTVRVLAAVFMLSVASHFAFHTTLLP